MWFGTQYGLNRYDGVQFQHFRTNDQDSLSLSDNYITSLFTDSRGVLWIGTSNGLNRYLPQNKKFLRIKLPGLLQKKVVIRNVYEDKSGQIWLSTNKGLFFSSRNNEFINISAYSSFLVLKGIDAMCLYQDSKKRYWLGTTHGLLTFGFNGKKVEGLKHYQSSKNLQSLSSNSISDMLEDKLGQLWVATENSGLNRYDATSDSFVRIPIAKNNTNALLHPAVRKMLLSNNGHIFIGTQEGLSVLDPKQLQFKHFVSQKNQANSLSQNSIYSLCEDSSGSVWIGTYYGGVNVCYAFNTSFKAWPSGSSDLTNLAISGILPEGANYWLGTEGGGLFYLDNRGYTITRFQYDKDQPTSLGSNLIKTLYKDSDGQLWLGTHGGGLNLLDRQHKKFVRFQVDDDIAVQSRSEIVSLLEDRIGNFWVGSQLGLRLFDRIGKQLHPKPLPKLLQVFAKSGIRMLFLDRRGDLWLAVRSSLYRYQHHKGKLDRVDLNNWSTNGEDTYVNCMLEDNKGDIWLGLYQAGLVQLDATNLKVLAHYNQTDGLADDNVVSIQADKSGFLWMGTSKGLTKLDIPNKRFINYKKTDGLPSEEFNYRSVAINSTGNLFFGSIEGLVNFAPPLIQENRLQSPLVFTNLLFGDKMVHVDDSLHILEKDFQFLDELSLKSSQNTFTIQFALLNFIKPEKNSYAYMIEGLNKDWVKLKSPELSFTSLSPGKYRLLVKGANNDGLWGEPKVLNIEVMPPFYSTWWAWVFYFALLGLLVFGIARYIYLQNILKKEELLHSQKLNFFTNISHEIRTHLALINVPVEQLLETPTKDKSTSKLLLNIKNQTNRLFGLVNELLDFRKIESDHLKLRLVRADLRKFCLNLVDAFQALAEQNKIELSFDGPNNEILQCFDPLQLEKVLFNLLSNAFKFTPTGGKIKLSLKQEANYFKIEVIDTGRGIAPEYLDKLFDNYFQVDDYNVQQTGYGIGLALSRKIVELHGGKIEVESKINTETTNHTSFCVVLPLNNVCENVAPSFETAEPKKAFLLAEEGIADCAIDALDFGASRILVVEDHPELRQALAEILRTKCEVITASNGQEALEQTLIELPDLVISDVMMPMLSGTELCAAIKNDERSNHIPVILLTAKTELDDELQGLEQGADVYIRKPFVKKILLQHVHNLLKSRRSLQEKYSQKFLLEPSSAHIENKDEQFLAKIIAIIETNMENEIFGVEHLAADIGMSYSVLNKKLKSLTNMSVNDFAKSIRLKRAAQLLKTKNFAVFEVAYMVGFSDRKYFSKEFKKQFELSPSEYAETH